MRHSGHIAQHDFSRSPQALIPRTKFNRTHTHKTTFNAGELIPFYVDEALPGDTFSMRATLFARIATLLFPIMDNLHMDLHFFFVPTRILWTHWEAFNGANIPDTDSSTDYLLPTITSPSGGYATSSIFDYMGLPTLVAGVETTSLPLRGYSQIYNDWYRDQNYNDMVTVETDDGPDPVSNYSLLQRNKRYDYFTSSLPFPQKGPAVSIPLIGDAPVISNQTVPFAYGPTFGGGGSGSPLELSTITNDVYLTGAVTSAPDGFYWGTVADPTKTGLVSDLSDVTAATINQIRLAATTQQMYEQDARGGTRYTEVIRSHFGIIPEDSRLQRAEFLGSSTHAINVTPVAQSSGTGITGQDSPQANLSAFGTVLASGGFNYSFQEHGYVYGIASVRADYTYWQGAERFWFRSARFDFYWPTFANIGEQAVLNQEIYCQGTSVDQEVFGYQEVWADYRYKPARLSGAFRPNATDNLDAWHLAQDFGSLPTLNDTFIAESPPMDRIEAATAFADFIMDCHIQLICARPMPMYSVPGIRRL